MTKSYICTATIDDKEYEFEALGSFTVGDSYIEFEDYLYRKSIDIDEATKVNIEYVEVN